MLRGSSPRRKGIRERRLSTLVLVVLAMFLTVAAGILAWFIVPDPSLLFARSVEPESERLTRIEFEDSQFVVPQGLVARIQRRTLGPVQQVDLLVPWPYDPRKPVIDEESRRSGGWILLQFEPDDGRLTANERFEKIFAHYFSGPPQSAAPGLIQYEFANDSPYAGMQLFVDRRAEPPVFLRCDTEPSSLGPVLCERRIRISKRIYLRYRFGRELLDRWLEVDRQVQHVIERIWRPASG